MKFSKTFVPNKGLNLMCGILATFYSSKIPSLERFSNALNLMEHRGPDDCGVKSGPGYLLGHRRLSIQDLSHDAVQPMTSEDGKVSIIFNGEVYNFNEIRKNLERKGHEFRTKSDTEVILFSYIENGNRFVDELIGMFSIIIVDERRGEPTILVLRDRLGIKPLYFYSESPGAIIFASEIKSILHLADVKFELSKEAVSSYLSFRYPIRNNTFFEGIKVVRPGYMLQVERGNIVEQEAYWKLSSSINTRSLLAGEDQCIDHLDDVFSSSVNYRTIADVPVGAYLSGGVDSSLIVAKMASERAGEVKTYTIGFDEEGYNEFEYASLVANRYETDHKEILLCAENYFEAMDTLIGYKDAPLSVPNEVPLYLMSRELKKDITVVLSGEGADEIFGGYGRIFRSADDYAKYRSGNVSPEFQAAYKRKYGEEVFDSELDHFYWSYSYIKPDLKRQFLNRAHDWDSIECDLRTEFELKFSEVKELSYPEKMMYVFETVHLCGLLNRVDTTTMAASVEARVPFVDHRLVELSFQVPLEYKLKWKVENYIEQTKNMISDEISEKFDTPKYILKRYGERYLPAEVLYRKKVGFPVPLDVWFGGKFLEFATEIIDDPDNPAFNLFDVKWILQFIDRGRCTHKDALDIWMILNVFVFARKYRSFIDCELP